jgi:hypothetical protein
MDARFALEGYVVDELIGFGGTGEVWRAHEVVTGETVALKRLRSRGAAATERLRREAALLATVAGPHVIGVRRLVVEGDEAVLVMEHAAGGSLATVLGVRGRLPPPEVVTVLAPIAAALAAAHARDLIHGDITPANILFTADGRPLLADFGVARALGTVPHRVEGTIDYLDPAVAAGAPPTAAADVFALGAVGFSALTGQSLWGSGPAEEILARASRGDRPEIAELAATAPEALVAVIESMLSVEPDDRPDARSIANAVLRACAAAPVGLVQTLAPTPPPMTNPVPPMTHPARSAATPSDPAADPGPDAEAKVRRPWRRPVVTAAAAALALTGAAGLGVGLAHLGRGQAQVLAATAKSSDPPVVSPWLAVVAHLDALRAQAFSEGEAAPLASVYTAGATAYTSDLTTVRSLASRGLRARGFTATVERVTVEAATATTERLRVVDRLTGYALVDDAGRTVGHGAARPAQAFSMSLTDVAGDWRVAAISPV